MEQQNSLSDQLEERLIEFAADIAMLSTELAGTPAAKHIALQILRSGTAPAPNYAEARSAIRLTVTPRNALTLPRFAMLSREYLAQNPSRIVWS
jgi:hypothetical protein